MSLDVRRQCAVCAWRETCTKKHTIKESSLHCPDFCRDKTLADDDADDAPETGRHKQIDDVFGGT